VSRNVARFVGVMCVVCGALVFVAVKAGIWWEGRR
jgi:hypothetical protein